MRRVAICYDVVSERHTDGGHCAGVAMALYERCCLRYALLMMLLPRFSLRRC